MGDELSVILGGLVDVPVVSVGGMKFVSAR